MQKNWFFSSAALLSLSLAIVSFVKKNPSPVAKAAKIHTIIIDAGHGFKGSISSPDGTHGENGQEDVISYEVAKKVVDEIKRQLPDVKVLETRPTPYFISLKERANFANENKGNLFISIHCNFAPRLREVRREGTRTDTYYVTVGKGKKKKKVKKTRQVPVYKTYYHPNPANGTETYVFAAHKTDDKEEIILENGDVFQNEKDDSAAFNININDPIVKQQVALWTKQFFANSVKLATIVEEEFTGIGRFSRGVKQRQKGIWVLQATAMPSILIELGFLSHQPEEEFLMSAEGQEQMAGSIAKSIRRYKDLVEKTQPVQGNVNNKK
jgi:N-acetylmuramoyl-L-alanine amidase